MKVSLFEISYKKQELFLRYSIFFLDVPIKVDAVFSVTKYFSRVLKSEKNDIYSLCPAIDEYSVMTHDNILETERSWAKMAAFGSHTFCGVLQQSMKMNGNAKVLQTKLAFCLGLTIDEWLWRITTFWSNLFSVPFKQIFKLKAVFKSCAEVCHIDMDLWRVW